MAAKRPYRNSKYSHGLLFGSTLQTARFNKLTPLPTSATPTPSRLDCLIRTKDLLALAGIPGRPIHTPTAKRPPRCYCWILTREVVASREIERSRAVGGPRAVRSALTLSRPGPRGWRRGAPGISAPKPRKNIKCSEMAHRLAGRQFGHVRGGGGFDPLRGASAGTLSCEPRIPWPPQARIQESPGVKETHLLNQRATSFLGSTPDPRVLSPPTPAPPHPHPPSFAAAPLSPSAPSRAATGSDDRYAPFRPTKPSPRDSVRLEGFPLGNFLLHEQLAPARYPPRISRLPDSPPPHLPTPREAEATHFGGPPHHPTAPKCDGNLAEGPPRWAPSNEARGAPRPRPRRRENKGPRGGAGANGGPRAAGAPGPRGRRGRRGAPPYRLWVPVPALGERGAAEGPGSQASSGRCLAAGGGSLPGSTAEPGARSELERCRRRRRRCRYCRRRRRCSLCISRARAPPPLPAQRPPPARPPAQPPSSRHPNPARARRPPGIPIPGRAVRLGVTCRTPSAHRDRGPRG
ncbi:collagen alpha-1(I) chain-like [Panthera leo]|uniref:collagen alpha-1(I) chain-like n=1 Tax=Panthera leo TaxID=9689 RepID=UPI001C6A7A2A|nr:collagen alpha-1(I) chain-like [Panthera leo]